MHFSPQQQNHHTLAKAAIRAAKQLGLTQEELGRVIGRDRTSFQRGIDPASKAGELALLVVRLYSALHGLCDGETSVIRHWFGTHNRDTDGIPREQVREPLGLVRLVDYLESQRGKC